MKVVNIIALLLVIVGAFNWGLVGLFNFDLVAYLFGGPRQLMSIVVYSLVGAAGVWSLTFFPLIAKDVNEEKAEISAHAHR